MLKVRAAEQEENRSRPDLSQTPGRAPPAQPRQLLTQSHAEPGAPALTCENTPNRRHCRSGAFSACLITCRTARSMEARGQASALDFRWPVRRRSVGCIRTPRFVGIIAKVTRSPTGPAVVSGSNSQWWHTIATTMVISMRARLRPGQNRGPPPKGRNGDTPFVHGAERDSQRSGSNAPGSGYLLSSASEACVSSGMTRVPAFRCKASAPSATAMSRTACMIKKGLVGRRRIDSLTTASA